MKLILKKSVAFLLMLAMLCLSAASCAKDPQDPADSDSAGAPTDTVDSSAGNDTQAPAETEGAALTYKLEDFAVIRADSAGIPAKVAADTLYSELKFIGSKPTASKTDVNVTASDDNLEILIGATNRAESEKVAAKLTADNQFAISFRKNKIVITARRTAALDDAVRYFLDHYTENGTVTANENHTYIGTTNLVELGADSVAKYSVVYSYMAGDELRETANILAERIKSRLKADQVTCTDDFETYEEGSNLIIIGNVDETKFPELEQVKADMTFEQYGVKVVDNRIYAIGNTAEAAYDAAMLLISRITNLAEEVDGKLYITIPDGYYFVDDALLSDYPSFSEGSLKECYYNENNELAYTYSNVSTASYEAYIAALNEAGYQAIYGEHTIGRNRFTTCVHEEKGQVHVAFYPTGDGIGDLQIYTSKLEKTAAIPQETYDPATDKITETTFHIMSLDYNGGAYATSKPITDGSGMSYVLTLEDGRFVIFDGGYTANDGHNLYNYLNAINQREDGIVIAAWFISHPHDDHTGGCQTFVNKYFKNVTIEYFVVNAASKDRYGSNHFFLSGLPSLVAVTGAKLIKPHTGQVLKFCNTEFEIMLTHENIAELSIQKDTNNSSTVVRIHENGHTILLTGDSSTAGSNKLVSLYGDALKSDVLQINHHGYQGGTVELYAKVAPTYAFYPTSQDSFDGRIQGKGNSPEPEPNLWIRDHVGIENCFIADDTIEWVTFPEDGELVINTETGYFVNSDKPVPENAGLLQTPAEVTE